MKKGFTLLEIMVALAILAVGMLSLIGAQGNALRASGRAENIQTATLLARQKMTEKMIEIQKEMGKGSFPDDSKNDQGTFDPPWDRYRWEFAVRKVEIPVVGEPPAEAGAAGTAGGGSGDTVQAPAAAQQSLAKMVTKKISESVREISMKILWEEMGEEQFLTVTTHIARVQ